MAQEIDFRALKASVFVYSETDSRWCFNVEKMGNTPPQIFSLHADVVNEVSEKLYQLQEKLGPPPSDLLFRVVEDWSFAPRINV
jgi:hypothetical protein